MEHETDDEEMGAPPSDAAERWAKLAMQARHSRLSRQLFEVEVDPPRMGRFELEALRGTGAMGAVFAARDPELERRVAVKLLTVPQGGARVELLRAETKALARLSHPNVVTIYDSGVEGDDLFVVMELVDGGPLSRLWLEGTPSIRELLEAFVQAGDGLVAVHEAGIVHCDFKPSNVLVTQDGRVKVADFGLARLAEVATSQPGSSSPESGTGSSTTTLRGTPAYMAPELLTGARPSERSDVFSFCVSLWEALHGCRPFPGVDSSKLGKPDEVMPVAAEAWRLQREHLPRGHSERGPGLALLAWLQLGTGDFEAALASNVELEGEYEQGSHRKELPAVSHDIGYCLCALGRCSEARERFTALHRQLAIDDPLAPYVASGLAVAELALGHHARAEALATETLARVLATEDADADLRAELRLVLVACRLATGERAAAEAFAREAIADAPSLTVRKLFDDEVIALLDGG